MKKSTFGLIALSALIFTPVAAFASDRNNMQINHTAGVNAHYGAPFSQSSIFGESNASERDVNQINSQSSTEDGNTSNSICDIPPDSVMAMSMSGYHVMCSDNYYLDEQYYRYAN